MSRCAQGRKPVLRTAFAALFLSAGLTSMAGAGTVEVVSRLDPSFLADDSALGASQTYLAGTTSAVWPTVSADGRFAVFTSTASTIVTFDTNNKEDVFLHDRQTDTVTLVSRGAAGPATIGNGVSNHPVISADGRWVAYLSTSTNLVTGQVERNSAADVFLYDRLSDTNVLVSRIPASATSTGNAICSRPHINDDGSFVTYSSHSTDLITGQTDTAGTYDVFVFDRAGGTNTLVSHTAASATTTGNSHSNLAALSGDGNWIAFTSRATNLVSGQIDTNNNDDVFLYERATGAVTLVSHTSGSPVTTPNSSFSRAPLPGLDASWIAYVSSGSNLASGQSDMNLGGSDVFLYERATGVNTLVSHVAASATQTASSAATAHSMSDDGRWIAYTSSASNLVAGQTDGNFLPDVFLYDRTTGTAALVSHIHSSPTTTGSGNGDLAVVSRDGSRVTFHGYVNNLVAGQTDTNGVNDVFVYDRASGTVTLASHVPASATTTGNAYGREPVIAGDGSSILFRSNSSNLVARDTNSNYDVFRFDAATGAVTLVSKRAPVPVETPGDSSELGQTGERVVSDDGRWVVFASNATDLVAGQVDTNGSSDVFLYDRLTRTTTLVSHTPGSAVTTSNRFSYDPAISADGRRVVFASTSTNQVTGQTGDFPDTEDVFLFDRQTGTVTLVSHRPGLPTTPGFCCSDWPSISADGNTVAYRSTAPNLIAGQTDTNNDYDIVLWDRASNTNFLVSHTSGSVSTASNGRSWPYAMSRDGAWITYMSDATNLMPSFTDGNGVQSDVFLWQRATDATTLVSHAAGLPTQGADSFPGEISISADGRLIAHDSRATDLVTGQTGASGQVFVYDRITGTNTLVSHVPASTTQGGNSFSDNAVISANGAIIVYETLATNLGTGVSDTNNARDLWINLVSSGAAGTNILVSHNSTSTSTAANGASTAARIDFYGDAIVFQTSATNVVTGSDTNAKSDVIYYERPQKKASFASRSLTSATTSANNSSYGPLGLNANGDAAIFASTASNLITYDLNGLQDLFLYSSKPVANLSITKTNGTDAVSPGQTVTWTITVTNPGPEAVTNIDVVDFFPASVTGVLWTCASTGGGSCPSSGADFIAAKVNLPVGSTVTFTATGVLDSGASGTLSNTAEVLTSIGYVDLDPSNNIATDADAIQ